MFKHRPRNDLERPMSDGIVDVTKSLHFLHSIDQVVNRRPDRMASPQFVRTHSHVFYELKRNIRKYLIRSVGDMVDLTQSTEIRVL